MSGNEQAKIPAPSPWGSAAVYQHIALFSKLHYDTAVTSTYQSLLGILANDMPEEFPASKLDRIINAKLPLMVREGYPITDDNDKTIGWMVQLVKVNPETGEVLKDSGVPIGHYYPGSGWENAEPFQPPQLQVIEGQIMAQLQLGISEALTPELAELIP